MSLKRFVNKETTYFSDITQCDIITCSVVNTCCEYVPITPWVTHIRPLFAPFLYGMNVTFKSYTCSYIEIFIFQKPYLTAIIHINRFQFITIKMYQVFLHIDLYVSFK